MGTNTDPYQWVEGRYKLMRGIWEAMRDFSNPCSILTKSPLLLRDKDLLCEIAERTQVSACLSVPTLDEKAWREHRAAHAEPAGAAGGGGRAEPARDPDRDPDRAADARDQRLAASRCEKIVALATEAGAVHIGGITLWLRGSVKEIFFDWLREHRPDLVERYERLYASGAYLPADERRTIERAGRRAVGRAAVRAAVPAPRRRADRPRSDGRDVTAGDAASTRALSEVMPRRKDRCSERRNGPSSPLCSGVFA